MINLKIKLYTVICLSGLSNHPTTSTFKPHQVGLVPCDQEKQWVPGPGSHATERSFVSDQNEFDAKRCVEVGYFVAF